MTDTEIAQVVIFDGACGLCSRFVRWSLDELKIPNTGFIPSQSTMGGQLLEKLGLPHDPSTVYLVTPTGVFEKSDAVLLLMKSFRAPVRHIAGLKILPKWLRDGTYGMISKIRRILPVKRVACEIDHCRQNLLLEMLSPALQEKILAKFQ